MVESWKTIVSFCGSFLVGAVLVSGSLPLVDDFWNPEAKERFIKQQRPFSNDSWQFHGVYRLNGSQLVQCIYVDLQWCAKFPALFVLGKRHRQLLHTHTYIYIDIIYTNLEPLCPLFLGFNSSKQGPCQQKKGHLVSRYIYIYIHLYLFTWSFKRVLNCS